MANVNITPNMNLPNPVPGQDDGPDYADNLQSSLNIVDQHNHVPGSGVPIQPGGLNINSDLTVNSNNLTNVRSVRFTPQGSPISGASDLGCLYESGVDLWYNDGSGNEIKLTSGGLVNATSSGISNGTASASFVASALVVNAATNTPANIQGASILIGNNVANSKYITLSPPNAIGSNYNLVLPSIPASQKILTLDTSGNISASYTVDNSTLVIDVGVIEVAAGGIQQSNLASRTTGSSVGAGGIAIAAISSFTTTSVTPVAVTGLSVSITTTGRPVLIFLQPSGGASHITGSVGSGTGAIHIQILNNSSVVSDTGINYPSTSVDIPPGGIMLLDLSVNGSAGSYTYSIKASTSGSSPSLSFTDVQLVAYEI